MPILDSCWSPCIWTNDLKTSCKAIACYTIAMSVVVMTFIIFDMLGGDSTQLYNPLFEADIPMQAVGGVAIVFFCFMIINSFSLLRALSTMKRGYMLPWMIWFGIVILFQLAFGLWLLGGYYIYIETVLHTFVIWCWMTYNGYCWLVVYSQYQVFEELQSPNIELLWP